MHISNQPNFVGGVNSVLLSSSLYFFIISKILALGSPSADTAFLQAEFPCSLLGIAAAERIDSAWKKTSDLAVPPEISTLKGVKDGGKD